MSDMNIQEIQTYLPHRYPFLLVDRVTECDQESKLIKGYKNLSANEQFFQGHFPRHPIMPGVLIVEALAQLAGILAFRLKSQKPSDSFSYYLAGLDKSRFKNPVYPGDRLNMTVTLKQERSLMAKFECEAFVDETQVCTTDLLLAGVKS